VDDTEKRRQLLKFLDERVFNPILDSPPRKGPDRRFFRETQNRVRRTWSRYPEKYQTASAIKQAFLSDLQSPVGQQLAALLQWLGLPRFEDVREDFLKLCRELGV
jgi:hypothetical protein